MSSRVWRTIKDIKMIWENRKSVLANKKANRTQLVRRRRTRIRTSIENLSLNIIFLV
jgi:hypothetical protein